LINVSVYQDCINSAVLERRQFQRLPVALQIELRVQGDSVPLRLQTSDVSAGGCYLEMMFTYEVGTLLDINLWLGHQRLSVRGRVVTRHPQFGNGVEFHDLSDVAKDRLQQLLEFAMAENSSEGKSRVI
jgi:c-di-GMP-binding flagellar brake protein YcgR